ncbi:(Fe-S)-binding protein [Candidatus Bathyarchaeota archaeon]|nr:(Fe-S)-binding protein [Candidatus Bathyarchaeota archaeon]MBS7631321.1 (Fe-S)-binding protein [Candidatus Bathyarchaeota archaeon]
MASKEIPSDKLEEALKHLNSRQRMELDTCAHCALCAETCPAYFESKNLLHIPGVRSSKVSKLINQSLSRLRIFRGRLAEKNLEELAESAYNCTLCGRCMEACPFGFQTHELWVGVRGVLQDLEKTPSKVRMLSEMLDEFKNPYGLEAETRLDWVDYTGLEEAPVKDKSKIAYFVGCTTAFKGANQNIAYSISRVLDYLKEDWTLLGGEEWCCGSPLLLSGDEDKARDFAEHNTSIIEERGIETLVLGCAGCFRVFKWEYPKLLGRRPRFKVVHALEYINDRIREGALTPEKYPRRVAYHDPCELSRLGGVLKEPREILRKISSSYVELPEHGVDVRCCGGGGLLQAVNNDLRLNIVRHRLNQAISLKVEVLTSACPACKLAFADGVRDLDSSIEVLDITELVARQMGLA